MTFMKTGNWRVVMLIDGTDTEGKATYQQIYQHKDGRKACVGPGYCSDPDLEWLLLQKDRKALQSEFFEWNTSELEDLDITYYDHFSYW